MKAQEKWDELIAHLAVPCGVLNEELSARDEKDVPARILLALLQKSTDTLRAIQLLYSASLPIQAQVLVRVLIELRMDLEIFLRLLDENPDQAARRVLDAMMLEKIKQQRQSDFMGWELVEGASTPDDLLELEQALIEVYGKDTVRSMQRFGFSGLSVEDRARETGLNDLYNVVYRNFSRNVHATDYMEHLAQGTVSSDHWADYVDSRDHVALSTAITCVWNMASHVDHALGCGLDKQLGEVWESCQKFEHWANVP